MTRSVLTSSAMTSITSHLYCLHLPQNYMISMAKVSLVCMTSIHQSSHTLQNGSSQSGCLIDTAYGSNLNGFGKNTRLHKQFAWCYQLAKKDKGSYYTNLISANSDDTYKLCDSLRKVFHCISDTDFCS